MGVTTSSMCACGCGQSLGSRPNQKYASDACRVRYFRRYGTRETVTADSRDAYRTNGVSEPRISLSAFDQKRVEALSLGKGPEYCCLYHLALSQEWPHRLSPNPYRMAD